MRKSIFAVIAVMSLALVGLTTAANAHQKVRQICQKSWSYFDHKRSFGHFDYKSIPTGRWSGVKTVGGITLKCRGGRPRDSQIRDKYRHRKCLVRVRKCTKVAVRHTHGWRWVHFDHKRSFGHFDYKSIPTGRWSGVKTVGGITLKCRGGRPRDSQIRDKYRHRKCLRRVPA